MNQRQRDGKAFLRKVDWQPSPNLSDEENAAKEAQWRQWWPEGTRYDVLAWDGGCHDRPTAQASFNNKKEAVAYIKQYNKNLASR